MNRKILIVEDDEFKANDLAAELQGHNTQIVHSVRDAVVRVLERDYELLILDMALPTFTANSSSSSGTAQPQGGIEVLRAIKSKRRATNVIIVSQYPDIEIDGIFISLRDAPNVLSERYDINVSHAIVYDFQNRDWAHELSEAMRQQ